MHVESDIRHPRSEIVAPEPADRPPVRLRPMPATSAPGETPQFQVRLVRLQHRLRPDAPIEDLWRLLGTSSVPYEKQALWESNDLRLGEGGQLATARLNELATETADRSARLSILTVTENLDFAVPIGGERDSLDLLWTNAAGRLMGRRFDKALAQFRVVCRSDPQDPAAVRLALVPEVLSGAEEMRWVRTEIGVVQRQSRATFALSDLAAEVSLAPGRLLVLGDRTASQAGDLSVGNALFRERRGPDVWLQTIILTAERIVPGRPTTETVPFMPSLKSAPPPAKPPAKPAAPTAAPTGKPAPATPGAPGATPATPAKPAPAAPPGLPTAGPTPAKP